MLYEKDFRLDEDLFVSEMIGGGIVFIPGRPFEYDTCLRAIQRTLHLFLNDWYVLIRNYQE